jgi:predicted acyl esterase
MKPARLSHVAAALLLAAYGCPSPAAPLATAPTYDVPSYFNRSEGKPLTPVWGQRLTGYLQTRDGVALRFSILLPKGVGPFPVIVNYSGYDPGAIGGDSYVHNNTAMANDIDSALLERGYAVLGVNARGSGCSEGTFDFIAKSYGEDGADIVEWAAKQPWSNGAVGMANWSWAGMSQVATASERPPHLKAIAPGMALTDPRLDSWAIGGVPSQGFIAGWWQFLHSRWLAVRASAVVEHDDRCVAQVDTNYAAGETLALNLPSLLIRHPLRDAWIDARTLLDRVDKINIPVLSMEAFQDEATTARAGYYQERLNPQLLWWVQTNGDHDLYESLAFRSILLDFLDHFVKGTDNGFERRPHAEIWEESTPAVNTHGHRKDESTAPRWVIHRQRIPVEVDQMVMTLTDNHGLSLEGRTGGAPDAYRYPVPGPTIDLDTDAPAWGASSPEWKLGSVAYTSGPLAKAWVSYGAVSADLWVSSSVADTDLQVTLTEVRPDGMERFVQRGYLRLSDRLQNTELSTTQRPMPCDRIECIRALVPDIPALGRVELTKVSYAFRAGSRVRIWIDAPSAYGENSFDHSSLPSTNKIWHDPEHPSRIVFGVLSDVDIPTEPAPCNAVMMQPCRADPLAKK